MTADDRKKARPPQFKVPDVPVPRGIVRAYELIGQRREQTQQRDVDHVGELIALRDRLSGVERILKTGEGPAAAAELRVIMDELDLSLRQHRGG